MKKFLAVALALALALSLGAAALAEGSPVATTPAEEVPVVTPVEDEEDEEIPEDLEDAAPEQADSAEAAVAAVSAETPVVAAAEVVTVTDDEGNESEVVGFAITDEDCNVVDAVPASAVKTVTLAAADEELEEEDAAQLKADVASVIAEEDEDNGAVISAFWFSLNSEAGENEEAVNNADGGRALKYTFACNANGSLPRVYLNGKALTVIDNGDGTYSVYLTEEGSVVIAVDAAE